MARMRRIVPLGLALALTGCSSDDTASGAAPAFAPVDDGLPDACHPLRARGACSLPFPSNHWLDESDAGAPRVALEAESMPASAVGGAFRPGRWNQLDGFSPATPLVAWFEQRIDPSTLLSYEELPRSVEAGASTWLLDAETLERVPHFAEVDLSADIGEEEEQPLMLRPAVHLRPGRRYLAVVTRRVRAVDGAPLAPTPGVAALLSGAVSGTARTERTLAPLREALPRLEAAGLRREDIALLWDFTTASLEAITTPTLTMRDRALTRLGGAGGGFQITSVERQPSAELELRVRGTFTVPSFLTSDDRTVAEVALHRDAEGLPAIRGEGSYPFDLMIPRSATTRGPLPLLIYGHGLLGEALDGGSGHVRRFCDDKGWICIGTDLIGLSYTEATGVGANAAALEAIRDVSKITWLTDRLQQGLVNTMVLVRTAPAILSDPRTFVDRGAGPVSAHDPASETVYYGISQGGIFGASLLAYAPDLPRGVLQVGGSGFSLFVQRSVNWNAFFPAIRNGYPDRRDQQVVLALWQPMLDFAEGSGTAWAQGTHPPLPGVTDKALLFQIAVGDSQVPNIGSEIQARTLGIPLLTPSAREVHGLEGTGPGARQAMVYWDLGRAAPPAGNATPPDDNDVHGDIRKRPENQEQTDRFLRTGRVEDTCLGACSFPGWVP